MSDGRIVKALSGYYYVRLHDRDQASVIQCRARGIFKKRQISPLVGDLVDIDHTGNDEGYITEIFPRQTELIRPPVANVDQAVLVFAMVHPAFSYLLLDRFLVHAEHAGVDPVIVLSKADLLSSADAADAGVDPPHIIAEKYEQIGYTVISYSAKTDEGLDRLQAVLQGKISVLAGQSGAGKSTLLNKLVPGIELKTGEVSMKLGRGKHTTRHVELVSLNEDTAVVDTPGFSQLDFSGITAEDLPHCFKDFQKYEGQCKFRGCLHHHEPDCTVRNAVEAGAIQEHRHTHYVNFLQEIKDQKRRY